ncbi:uncharacterized protein LOC130897178 isoform X1 [Diorhabda carinulata]|uniref:uncharacterized protein LOC130897178 isoform X1 n=1 Tax=Diorhabda carinulata TaxID=1163345 RepID=UPI0025A06437|nr:uncharacterized protein LOC130897178 isoform X1 [Diorhabda carinulata]
MKMLTMIGVVIIAALNVIRAAPTSNTDDSTFKFPITFENGKIGVNFLGFHAAAGLGGILTGNEADGGLQAEAGTPFGQKAWAGLGGGVNGAGRSAGGLYAGATAGGGVGAKAGIGGTAGSEGSFGTSYAGASAGGLYKGRVKSIGQPAINISERKENVAAAVGDVGAGGSLDFHVGLGANVNSQANYDTAGGYKVKQFQQEFVEEDSPVDTSNVQVIAKKEKVKSIQKTVVEQDIDEPQAALNLDVRAQGIVAQQPPPAQLPVYVEKRKYKLRRRPHHRKQVIITNTFVKPPPVEIPAYRYTEDIVEEPAPVIVKEKTITHGINVPVPTLNAAEELVANFAGHLEVPPPKPVVVGNVGLSKSFSLGAEAVKAAPLLNIQASKQISING